MKWSPIPTTKKHSKQLPLKYTCYFHRGAPLLHAHAKWELVVLTGEPILCMLYLSSARVNEPGVSSLTCVFKGDRLNVSSWWIWSVCSNWYSPNKLVTRVQLKVVKHSTQSFALIPMGLRDLKLKIHQFSLVHLRVVVSSRAVFLLIVSNIC